MQYNCYYIFISTKYRSIMVSPPHNILDSDQEEVIHSSSVTIIYLQPHIVAGSARALSHKILKFKSTAATEIATEQQLDWMLMLRDSVLGGSAIIFNGEKSR